MEGHQSERLKAVEDLLNFSMSLELSAQRLRRFDWDYIGQGVILRPQHLKTALRRYLIGEVSAGQIEAWANLIEGRDDVDLLGGADGWVGRTLHELANPILFTPLSAERASIILSSTDTVE